MGYIFLLGFILGIFIPMIARRFGKIDLIDPGHILLDLWYKRPALSQKKQKKRQKSPWYPHFEYLRKLFFIRSFLWGLILGALGVLSFAYTPFGPWLFPCLICLCYLMAIDTMHYVLPDFFTLPLLLLGFGAAIFGGLLTPESAFFGAIYGYVISVIAVLVMAFKKSSEFGAGDVKLLTALGAWVGIEGLIYTIILSFIFFALGVLRRRTHWGAYGPSLGASAILILFYFYAK